MRIDISDPEDKRLEVFQGLRDHELRQLREKPGGDMAGVFICEGDLPVERAINAGYKLQSILIDGKRTKPLPIEIKEDVIVYVASPKVLLQITGYNIHRGCIACFARKDLLSVEEVLSSVKSNETLLIIEGINNPTNMGVILRCAAGLGVGGILMDKTCSDPLYRRSVRVSMGEGMNIKYARFENWPEDLELVKKSGFEIWAFTPAENAVDLKSIKVKKDEKIAVMVGTEATGLSQESLELADQAVKITMKSGVDSLNVGAATAIALYQVMK